MLERILERKWFYNLAIWAVRSWARLFLGLKVTGRENVPLEGGLVVACNHFSSLDPPIVGVSVPREIHFMAKRELFDRPAGRLLMQGLRAYPVNRSGSDTGALRHSLRKLADGLAIGIFIQGTRNAGDKAALDGAAFLALRSGCSLLPTAVWREGRSFRVHFGEALDVADSDLTARQVTALLTDTINGFLPPDRRMHSAVPDSATEG